jgi:hypothetical protein
MKLNSKGPSRAVIYNIGSEEGLLADTVAINENCPIFHLNIQKLFHY